MILKIGAAVALAGLAGGALWAAKPAKDVQIGGYATSLKGRTPNQRHNAQLAMKSLRSIRIEPGQTFSFNRTVGSFSRDRGYRRAPVSYNGNLIKSWGGGVCQSSTTVYNAALVAGLDIVERNRHRFAPSYVPPGRDAAVAFDTIDLKIKNPYPFAIELRGSWTGDRLQAGFYAHERPVEATSLQSEVVEVGGGRPIHLNAKSGTARVRNTGKMGYDVTVYRSRGGKRELVSKDYYAPMPKVIEYD